jgi:DNA-binding beta-propeller fold protein YncE
MRFLPSLRLWISAALSSVFLLSACTLGGQQPPRPNGIAVAPDGNIYVMALGSHRVVQLSPDGRQLSAFGRLGDGPADIYEGWGAALDAAGNIILCHIWRSEEGGAVRESIKVFSPAGRPVREIVAPGDDGAEGCYSVRVDDAGRIFAVYNNTDHLRVFDGQGKLLATLWGETGTGPGQFIGLRDVAIDAPRGLLYASDAGNSRIQQFDLVAGPTGEITATHRLSFGAYGHELGELAYPQYLAVDEATGRLAVGDMANRRIQIFDPQGNALAEMTPPGVDDWQVMGLAFAADGALLAADALNGVIWVFEPDGRLRQRIEVPS